MGHPGVYHWEGGGWVRTDAALPTQVLSLTSAQTGSSREVLLYTGVHFPWGEGDGRICRFGILLVHHPSCCSAASLTELVLGAVWNQEWTCLGCGTQNGDLGWLQHPSWGNLKSSFGVHGLHGNYGPVSDEHQCNRESRAYPWFCIWAMWRAGGLEIDHMDITPLLWSDQFLVKFLSSCGQWYRDRPGEDWSVSGVNLIP